MGEGSPDRGTVGIKAQRGSSCTWGPTKAEMPGCGKQNHWSQSSFPLSLCYISAHSQWPPGGRSTFLFSCHLGLSHVTCFSQWDVTVDMIQIEAGIILCVVGLVVSCSAIAKRRTCPRRMGNRYSRPALSGLEPSPAMLRLGQQNPS